MHSIHMWIRVATWSTLFHQFYIVSSEFTSTNSPQHYNFNAKTPRCGIFHLLFPPLRCLFHSFLIQNSVFVPLYRCWCWFCFFFPSTALDARHFASLQLHSFQFFFHTILILSVIDPHIEQKKSSDINWNLVTRTSKDKPTSIESN